MSFAALAWAGKCRAGSASRKLVLFALADRHNDEHDGAYPSIAWIAEFTSLNRKTVINCLGDLEALGLITDTGERRGTTAQIKFYRLHLETVPKSEQFQKRNSSKNGAKQSQKRDTEPVRTRSLQKATPSSGRARKAKPKIPLPEGWQPKPLTPGTVCAQIVAAWQPGRIERELSKFRDHHLRSDARWSDWDATWRTWIQNSGDFERQGNGQRNTLRGTGPDPLLADYRRAVEEERAGLDQETDPGAWTSLSAAGGGSA